MQFLQTAAVPQLYDAADDGGATPGTLLYLLPQATADPPATIDFAGSWSTYTGCYIFLAQPLAAGDEKSFATAAWNFLSDPRMQGVRFAWFSPLGPSGLLEGTAVAVYQPGGRPGFATAFPVTLPFQNISLSLPANTTIAPDEANAAFTFTPRTSTPIILTANWGSVTIDGVGSPLTLPIAGGLAGCLQFMLQLTQQNLADLDIGLRYFFAVPPDVDHPNSAAGGPFLLGSLRYPVFDAALTLYANLDPLAPLNSARSFFAFNGADAGQPSAGPAAPLPAYFNATLGDPFTLQPLTGSQAPTGFAALVFATNQQASAASTFDPFYLVPRGDFALQSARSGPVALMCGLSGVEYFQLSNGTELLSFFPGQDAFAAGFFPGQPPGYTDLTPSVPPTTAFASVTASPGPIDYFAQPDQSVLYNYPASPVPNVTMAALAAVPVQASTVDWPPAPSLVFPLMPYSGLGGQNLTPYQQMESQIIAPARRLALGNAPARPRPGAAAAGPQQSKYSTTPQGLLATYVPGASVWDEIVLAQTGPAQQQLLLTSVQDKLLAAFQSNKLFLVISKPAAIQSSLTANNALITVGASLNETWNFDIDPGQDPTTHRSWWSDYGTILIIKFSDMSIQELARQTSTWAYPDDFNDSAAATSKTIEAIIAAADPTSPDFAAFVNAVSNPSWNGLLILNARTPLQGLPSELAGLAVGIDQSRFFAHHVGITASKIDATATPSDIGIDNSSVFGLINYTAPAPLQPGGQDYQFQVQQLKVLFLNSALASFSSIIDLQINALFAEPVTLEQSADNILQMFGVYQKHVVGNQTLDSYSFQTKSGQVSTFDLKSNVLNAVQVSKGQFITLYPQPIAIAAQPTGAARTGGTTTVTTTVAHSLSAGDGVTISGVTDSSFDGQFSVATVPSPTTFTYAQSGLPDATSGNGVARATATVTQFVLWGLVDFQALANFDLFSFGRPMWSIAAPPAGVVHVGGVTTITTTAAHGFAVGDTAVIAGVSDSLFDGQFSVTTVPSPTTFTYAQSGLPDATAGNGAAKVPTPAGLSFGNLVIEMTFDAAVEPPAPQFTFDSAQLSFDMAGSTARPHSFYSHFPLTVAGFTQAKQGTAPTDGGYMGLQTPLNQATLVYPWFSLNFDLNLGSPGALAAQAGFVAGLTAAWSPNLTGIYAVFTGLKLPGSSGSKRQISIEGLFAITFKTLEIVVLPESDTYILVLYGIGFKFLAFTFPPTGQVNFVLFGDPNAGTSGNTSLGWYAAYAKPQTTTPTKQPAALPAATTR